MKFINFLNRYLYFIVFLSIGLFVFNYPAVKSGFDLIIGNYDSLYYNYVLEHGYLWLKGSHGFFYSPPFNYPHLNALAYFDTLIGYLPFYSLFRLFIKNPISAFEALFTLCCILNYSSFYYFLRKTFKFNRLVSSVGAYIFAFSIFRYFRAFEIGTFSQFYSIIALIFLLKVNKKNTNIKNHFNFLLFSVFMLLQFYTCFSLGFFTMFMLFWTFIFALVPKTSRDVVVCFLQNHYKMLLFYLFVILIMLLPMAYHFSLINRIYILEDVLKKLSNSLIWIRNASILDCIFYKKLYYIGSTDANLASVSLGIFTMFTAILGFFKVRCAKGLPYLILGFIFLVSCNYSAVYFWRVFYYLTLGLESIKTINNIAFMALIVVAVGICYFISNIKNKKLLFICILILLLEQLSYNIDPNSSWKTYYLSKNRFLSQLDELKDEVSTTENDVFYVSTTPVKREIYGKKDATYKDEIAQKMTDIIALWLTIKTDKYCYNNYETKKPKPLNGYFEIKANIDYSEI